MPKKAKEFTKKEVCEKVKISMTTLDKYIYEGLVRPAFPKDNAADKLSAINIQELRAIIKLRVAGLSTKQIYLYCDKYRGHILELKDAVNTAVSLLKQIYSANV